ncbi:MAG: hypothetical protein Q9214_004986 [Letrouitia sp. 1 TL-2023]
MPPIPVSSKSKSKLEAFHFHDRTAESDTLEKLDLQTRGADKENRPTLEDSKNTDALHLMPCPQSFSQRSSQKECPQTPVGRLPLAELIAGTNDNTHQKLDLTPVERVLWNLSPSTSQLSSSQERLASRRGQKRARSSSPTAPSEKKKPKPFTPGKQPMDSYKSQRPLKTPQADPASDLWSRYSNANADDGKASPTRLREEVLVELMKSSSPQTPPSHLRAKELGGLRRSISCTNDWPESVAKKRRLNHSTQHTLATAGTEASGTEHLCQSTTNISRVSILVERMQDELNGSFKRERGPSQPAESSPSPEKKAGSQTSSQTPSNQAEDTAVFASQPFDMPENGVTLNSPNQRSESEGTSDFGDDEFNDEMLDIINTSLLSACSTNSESGQKCQKEVTETHDTVLVDSLRIDGPENCIPSSNTSDWGELCYPGRCSGESSLQPNYTYPRNQPNLIAKQTDQDEFSVDETEVPSADLEHLASLYDQQTYGETTEDPDNEIATWPADPQYPLEEADVTVKRLENRLREDTGVEVVNILSEEEFGEEPDFEDFLDGCAEATQANSQCLSRKRSYTIQRYLIVSIAEEDYETPQGQKRSEKVLSVQKDGTSVRKLILLREHWFSSPCLPGSFLHLIGKFDEKGQCIVDNTKNLIILHPDHLVSATVVGDSFSCIRRAVLQDRVKVTSASSASQIYGHILHEIFQEAMKANKWDNDWLHKTIELVASNYLESFFEINLDPVVAVKQLKIKAASLQSWAKTFVASRPNSDATIRDRHGGHVTFCVNKLLEVEEKIWSPMYGLKGNVDATVQVLMDDGESKDTLTPPISVIALNYHQCLKVLTFAANATPRQLVSFITVWQKAAPVRPVV